MTFMDCFLNSKQRAFSQFVIFLLGHLSTLLLANSPACWKLLIGRMMNSEHKPTDFPSSHRPKWGFGRFESGLSHHHLEVSWNRATPSHRPFLDGIFPNKNHPLLGYPHDHGHPHLGIFGRSQAPFFTMNQAKERKEAEAILKDCNGQVDAAEAWQELQNHRFEWFEWKTWFDYVWLGSYVWYCWFSMDDLVVPYLWGKLHMDHMDHMVENITRCWTNPRCEWSHRWHSDALGRQSERSKVLATSIYLYLYVYIYMYIYIYVHTHICIYIYTHVYIYIHMSQNPGTLGLVIFLVRVPGGRPIGLW